MMQSPVRLVSRSTTLLAAGLLGAAILSSGGCSSAEMYTYTSEAHSPKTITLINTATGEKVWTCDVPVGQKLEMRFAKKSEQAEELGYDELAWSLSGVSTEAKGRKSTVRVPPASQRRIDMTLRSIPESR